MNQIFSRASISHHSSMLLLIGIVVVFASYTVWSDSRVWQAVSRIEEQFSPVTRLEKICAKVAEMEKNHRHSDDERRELNRKFLQLATAADVASERMAEVLVKFGHTFHHPEDDWQVQQCLNCLEKAAAIFDRLLCDARAQSVETANLLRPRAQECRFELADAYNRFGRLQSAQAAYTQAFALAPLAVPSDCRDPNHSRFEKYSEFLAANNNHVDAARLRLSLESGNQIEVPSKQSIERQTASCLTGRWELAFFSCDTGGAFDLVLEAGKDRVTGRYCAFERVEFPFFATQDTLNSKVPGLTGKFENGVAKLTLLTNAGLSADVSIVRIGDYLIWHLADWKGIDDSSPAQSGPYAIPFTAVLRHKV